MNVVGKSYFVDDGDILVTSNKMLRSLDHPGGHLHIGRLMQCSKRHCYSITPIGTVEERERHGQAERLGGLGLRSRY
jgi:hypothetical protein